MDERDRASASRPRHVLLAGGGSGGHVFPALAVGAELGRRGWRVSYAGDPTGMEARLVAGRGLEFVALPARPLVGRGPLHDDTVWLSALLADPTITRAVAVSVGEELVVSETNELVARLRAETQVTVSALVANRLPPPIGPTGEAEAGRLAAAGDALAPVATLAVARHRSWCAQRERLATLGLPLVEVPDQPIRAFNPGVDPKAVLSRKSVVVMSSGGNQPVFDEGRNGHSPFAWNFMNTLRDVSLWQAGGQVFERVRFRVAREVPQRPKYGAANAAGHQAGGEYLFEFRELDAR